MSKPVLPFEKLYIPQTVGEVVDQLGSMMLAAPKFKSRLPWDFEEDINTNFHQLNEGLKKVRRQIGEQTYTRIAAMSQQMHAHFEADPEDKNGECQKGRILIDEMTDILRASRKRKIPRAGEQR